MNKENLQKIAKENLSDLLNESGSILYSSHETLKPNDIYLLGFNPGGKDGAPLSKSIDKILHNTENAYLDECWENGNGAWEKGEALLQKRVQWTLEVLGFNPRNVCASNLIFIQSKKANDINYSLAKQCWPVHEAIIAIVKPKMLLTFGNSDISPYGYLKSMFGGAEDSIDSGHGNWRVKEFSATINNKKVIIVGLPHLSRYEPKDKDEVFSRIKSKALI